VTAVVNDTGFKFVAGINNNGGKCAAVVFDTGGSPSIAYIFATFRKKILMTEMGLSGT
jgi:hypothetical protein